jgi:branched-chain amino acid transport system substrate-binding protein
MKLRNLGALAVAALLVAGACQQGAAPGASGGAKGTIKIGVTLPLSGGAAADGQPALKGAKLAVDEANAKGGVAGYTLQLTVLDHAVNGKYNEQQGAKDMQTFVGDSAVIGVVGPYNSAVAKAQIPISNQAGLLQCSPANTNESLTKPEFGALDFRKAKPDKINYIRVATTDDIQGPSMADYAFKNLNIKKILVVNDVTTFGKGVADNFAKEFQKVGGTVVDNVGAGVDTTDFVPIITNAKTKSPEAIYYGGVVTSGAGLLLKQMSQQGLNVPFLGPDGIKNGSGEEQGSLIQIAGSQESKSAYATVAAIGDFPAKKDFDARFIEHFKGDSEFKEPGAYSGPAYACAQVILKSIEEAAKSSNDMASLREATRAYAASGASFDTVLGKVTFDKNGDTSQKIISFYKVDPSAKNGKGDWVFVEQQDFGGK